mmetsp:Transcript_61001/g.160452  ORF Transcript_61001/g.160452 Transcript_61001/m.160452 type:complete len:305 (+) Transcript_61001:340-1254(+)
MQVVVRQMIDEEHADEGHDDAERLQRMDRRMLAHPQRLSHRPRDHVPHCPHPRLLERHFGAPLRTALDHALRDPLAGALEHALASTLARPLDRALGRPLREPLAAPLDRALARPLKHALGEALGHVLHDPLRCAEAGLLDPTVLQLVLRAVQRVSMVVVAMAIVMAVAMRLLRGLRLPPACVRTELAVGGLPGRLAHLPPGRLARLQLRRCLLHRGVGRRFRRLRRLERRRVRRLLVVQAAPSRRLGGDRLLQRDGRLRRRRRMLRRWWRRSRGLRRSLDLQLVELKLLRRRRVRACRKRRHRP